MSLNNILILHCNNRVICLSCFIIALHINMRLGLQKPGISIQITHVQKRVHFFVQPIWEETKYVCKYSAYWNNSSKITDSTTEHTEECAIPDFGTPEQYKLPATLLHQLLTSTKFYSLYSRIHFSNLSHIPTKSSLFKCHHNVSQHVFAFCNEIDRQVDHILKQGVLEEAVASGLFPL